VKCIRPMCLCPSFGKGARIAVVLAGLLKGEMLLVSNAHGTVGPSYRGHMDYTSQSSLVTGKLPFVLYLLIDRSSRNFSKLIRVIRYGNFLVCKFLRAMN